MKVFSMPEDVKHTTLKLEGGLICIKISPSYPFLRQLGDRVNTTCGSLRSCLGNLIIHILSSTFGEFQTHLNVASLSYLATQGLGICLDLT